MEKLEGKIAVLAPFGDSNRLPYESSDVLVECLRLTLGRWLSTGCGGLYSLCTVRYIKGQALIEVNPVLRLPVILTVLARGVRRRAHRSCVARWAPTRGARWGDGRGDAPARRYDSTSKARLLQERASGTTNEKTG